MGDFQTPTLTDLEWNFGVTSATEQGQDGSTFLQLKMTVLKDGVSTPEFVELNLAQFYGLLEVLERARSKLELVTNG